MGPEGGPLPLHGTYKVEGDQLLIDWERADWPDETSRWSYYGGKLTFTSIRRRRQRDQALYLAHPWRRVR